MGCEPCAETSECTHNVCVCVHACRVCVYILLEQVSQVEQGSVVLGVGVQGGPVVVLGILWVACQSTQVVHGTGMARAQPGEVRGGGREEESRKVVQVEEGKKPQVSSSSNLEENIPPSSHFVMTANG